MTQQSLFQDAPPKPTPCTKWTYPLWRAAVKQALELQNPPLWKDIHIWKDPTGTDFFVSAVKV